MYQTEEFGLGRVLAQVSHTLSVVIKVILRNQLEDFNGLTSTSLLMMSNTKMRTLTLEKMISRSIVK